MGAAHTAHACINPTPPPFNRKRSFRHVHMDKRSDPREGKKKKKRKQTMGLIVRLMLTLTREKHFPSVNHIDKDSTSYIYNYI